MTKRRTYPVEHGKISPLVKLENYNIRFVEDRSFPEEDETDNDLSTYMCQGHISNTSGHRLEDLCIDISYFAATGEFLGLDKTGLLDIDEIDSGETLPFSISLDVPEGTTKCVLNATAKRKGLFSRLL
jgi:hypothetical protein